MWKGAVDILVCVCVCVKGFWNYVVDDGVVCFDMVVGVLAVDKRVIAINWSFCHCLGQSRAFLVGFFYFKIWVT